MFGIGMPELILILVVALIVIGPRKLPDMARSLGKALNEFKSATQDFRDSIDSEVKDLKNLDKKDMGRIGEPWRKNSEPGGKTDDSVDTAPDPATADDPADDPAGKTGIDAYDDPEQNTPGRGDGVKTNE